MQTTNTDLPTIDIRGIVADYKHTLADGGLLVHSIHITGDYLLPRTVREMKVITAPDGTFTQENTPRGSGLQAVLTAIKDLLAAGEEYGDPKTTINEHYERFFTHMAL